VRAKVTRLRVVDIDLRGLHFEQLLLQSLDLGISAAAAA
jgi:hypothetical protein